MEWALVNVLIWNICTFRKKHGYPWHRVSTFARGYTVKSCWSFVIPTHLDQLMNLRNLSISGTTIKRAAIKFHTNSLETLNFSCNPIEEVLLLLPEGVTNLRLVTLSHNQILMISMECIGHNTKALNSNLYDLDEDQISSLISNLPKATQCLWTMNKTIHFVGKIIYTVSLEVKYRCLNHRETDRHQFREEHWWSHFARRA